MQISIKTTIKYHRKLRRMLEMKSLEDTESAKIWSSRNYQTGQIEAYTSKTTLENQKFLFNLNTGKPRNWAIPSIYPKKYNHMISNGHTNPCSKQHHPKQENCKLNVHQQENGWIVVKSHSRNYTAMTRQINVKWEKKIKGNTF